MALPTAADYEELRQQVDSLTEVVIAFAKQKRAEDELGEALSRLLGPPARRADSLEDGPVLSNAEAAAYCCMAVSTFRTWKNDHDLQPVRKTGNKPFYRQSDLDKALSRAARKKE